MGRGRLASDAEIYSDGLSAFRPVEALGRAHTVIDAGGGRAATEAEGARWANLVLVNVKRMLDGTYHGFRFAKNAERYLGETAWRFNRGFRLEALVPRVVVTAARCPVWPERPLRGLPEGASGGSYTAGRLHCGSQPRADGSPVKRLLSFFGTITQQLREQPSWI